ncbi:MAG: response regulator, partial [bacterium]
KFTASGSVILRARAEQHAPGEHALHLAVEDTGVGIPADRLDRLFQSFTQVDASTTRRFGGTGLGLAIVRRLVEHMCGRVWVESEVGVGSTFHVRLLAAEAGKVERQRTVPLPAALCGRRALVVDDHAVNRQILESHLGGWGMVVEQAASAAEALEHFAKGARFDVVVTDHRMPERDGLDLALAIAGLALPKPPRIVLSSSSAYSKSEITRRRIPIDGYLAKPVRRAPLFDLLVRLLDDARLPTSAHPPVASIDLLLGERHPLRILLAEDNTVNQKVALGLLAKLGYRADVAADGVEALAALERQVYDVLLLDVNMPRLDGLAAARRIRDERSAEARPHMIAMTAEALAGDRERCLEAGMDDYVSKPVRIEELADALVRAAEQRGVAEVTPETIDAQAPTDAFVEPGELLCATDLDTLRDAVGDEVADKIVSDYVESSVGWLSDLTYAIRTCDLERARRLAHDLKSTSRLVGALRAATLASDLELRARNGAMGDPQPALRELDRVLAAAHSLLLSYRATAPRLSSLTLADPPSDAARRRSSVPPAAQSTPRAA